MQFIIYICILIFNVFVSLVWEDKAMYCLFCLCSLRLLSVMAGDFSVFILFIFFTFIFCFSDFFFISGTPIVGLI